jgi:hypothetical protein
MSKNLVLKTLLRGLVALPLALGLGQAHAALNAVDPGPYNDVAHAPYGGFPIWYQDTNGLGLDLCLSGATIGGLPACILPAGFVPPFTFPGNFPDESFYFMGDANFTAGGVTVNYAANLEAAFGTGAPAAGQQITFARIRIRITLPGTAPGGNYTVTHPYGVEVFSVAEGGGTKIINATRDIGVAPGIFTGALNGDIGPFLRDASLAPGACIPSSVPGECYIGDPNTPRPVLGSPFGTNFVRVDGPAPFASVQSNLFTVMGKVHNVPGAPLATPLQIERTTYGRTAAGAQQDVFVKAPPSTNYAVTAIDGNAVSMTLTDSDANGAWYGQSPNDPTTVPTPISVTAGPTVASGLTNAATTGSSNLVDLITISKAEATCSAAAGTCSLTVEAASSDQTAPRILSVNGRAMTPLATPPLQTISLTGLVIPPATVTVTSDVGGSDTEDVIVKMVP